VQNAVERDALSGRGSRLSPGASAPTEELSHTSTLVRVCCKDDDQSQWEKP